MKTFFFLLFGRAAGFRKSGALLPKGIGTAASRWSRLRARAAAYGAVAMHMAECGPQGLGAAAMCQPPFFMARGAVGIP